MGFPVRREWTIDVPAPDEAPIATPATVPPAWPVPAPEREPVEEPA